MDPLGVTASIAGLGTAAREVDRILRWLNVGGGEAGPVPSIVSQLLALVRHTRHSLAALKDETDGLDTLKPSQIQAHQIVAVFTDGVIVFSDLEMAVTGLDQRIRTGRMWPTDLSNLKTLMKRLGDFQQSISMIVTILQADSHYEGARHRIQLTHNVEILMGQNAELNRRVVAAEKSFDMANIRSKKQTIMTSITEKKEPTEKDEKRNQLGESVASLQIIEEIPPISPLQGVPKSSSFDFESDLADSGVYQRAHGRNMRFSVGSSMVRPWSCLSEVSDDQFSSMSLMALPVFAEDIANPHHYDFDSYPSYPPPPYTPMADDVIQDQSPPPARQSLPSQRPSAFLMSGTEILHAMYYRGTGIFHHCMAIRAQLNQIPGFPELIYSYVFEKEPTNPLEEIIFIFRQGLPLFLLFGQIDPSFNTEVARNEGLEADDTVLRFFSQCEENDFDIDDYFVKNDLMGTSNSGYLKVAAGIELVLSQLVSRGDIQPVSRRDFNLPENTDLTPLQVHLESFIIQERRYFLDLGELLEMKDFLEADEALSHKLHTAFDSLRSIIHYQVSLLLDVETQLLKPRYEQRWGTPFVAWGKAINAYLQFIQLEDDNVRALRIRSYRLSSSKQRNIDAIMKCIRFLSMPHDQLRKYQDFFRNLSRLWAQDVLPTQITDLDKGASAVDAVFEAAYQAAERVTTQESLLDLKTRMIDWKGYQVDNFGELIMADQMKGLNYVDIGKDTAKTYWVYLFERILICCRQMNRNPGKNSLALRGRIWVRDMQFIEAREDKGTPICNIGWKSNDGNDVLRFKFRSCDQRDTWVAKLGRLKSTLPV